MIPYHVVTANIAWAEPGEEWVQEPTVLIPKREPKETENDYLLRAVAYLRVAFNLPTQATLVLTIPHNGGHHGR